MTQPTQTRAAPQNQTPPKASRMTLSAVKAGRVDKPPTVLLYGVEGVGKSTWASCAPSPIFIDAEDGTARMDVPRFPRPQSWEDVRDAVKALTVDTEHKYQTLVIDTLDALEPLCWAHVCEKAKKADIEAFGYGKGYTAALSQWRVLVADLERLTRKRGMGVILLAHSWIKTFKNPEGEDFDRYQLKLHDKASGLMREWAEVVMFAGYETFAAKDSATKRVRGVSTGARVVHTNRTAAFDAKNRFGLPDSMPLDWQAFVDGMAAGVPADAATLTESAATLIAQVTDAEMAAKMREAVEAANGNAAQLSRIVNKIQARLLVQAKEEVES